MFTLETDSSWKRKKEKETRKGRQGKKMISIEGYSSCANTENGAINSSHPFDGSLKTLCVNSFAVQAPVENNTVKNMQARTYKA